MGYLLSSTFKFPILERSFKTARKFKKLTARRALWTIQVSPSLAWIMESIKINCLPKVLTVIWQSKRIFCLLKIRNSFNTSSCILFPTKHSVSGAIILLFASMRCAMCALPKAPKQILLCWVDLTWSSASNANTVVTTALHQCMIGVRGCDFSELF